jgi:ABC-2 type transport system permease protein
MTRSPADAGPLALLAHQVRFDMLALARNRRARFFTIVFPIVLLVIFAGMFGGGNTVVNGVRVKTSEFYVPAIMTMSLMTTCFIALATAVVSERSLGVLKRRRATPVPAWVLIAGRVLSSTALTILVLAVMLVVARVAYGVSVPSDGIVPLLVGIVAGGTTFCCIGYAIASVVGSVDTVQPLIQLTTLPLYIISGIWVPTDALSNGLRNVAKIFPVEHLSALIHQAYVPGTTGGHIAGGDLLVLAAWAGAAALFAARRFSWLPAPA